MTKSAPRIRPIPAETIPDDVRAALQGWLRPDATSVPTPLDTLARHPELIRAFLSFNRHLLYASSLPARTRELVILRTAVICDCAYEHEQHAIIAGREGLSESAIERVARGADAAGWSVEEAALLRATDELLTQWNLSDATWAELAEHLDEHQRMDLVFTIGGYALLAMAFNTFEVQTAPGERSSAERWGSGESGPRGETRD